MGAHAMKSHTRIGLLVSMAALPTIACLAASPATKSQNQVDARATFRPEASFQEIMGSEVVPSSANLWNAVSTKSTAQGIIENRPTTDEAWLSLRHQALILIEAGNLLLMKDRPIVARGGKVKDAEQPGILGPEQIRHAMDADPAKLARLVHALQGATGKALEAIEKKDSGALSDAGGAIDEACEACHKTYWYPE